MCAEQVLRLQYFARDGSLSSKIYQLGWDNQSTAGTHYAHLSLEGGGILFPCGRDTRLLTYITQLC
jgi:hypothetical protein